MKIIDAHAHVVQCIAGTGSQGELRPCGGGRAVYATGSSFQILPPEIGEYDAAPEALLRVMDAHGVEKAVLLQGNYFGFQNLYTWEAIQKYPARFTGAAAYDPFCAQAERIKAHLFDELGFRIVKFEVSSGSGLMANHPPVDLDGEVMHAAYRHAAERNLIFVIDIGKPERFPYPTARGYVCDAVNIVGAGRLLWGSDMPSAMTWDSYRHFIDFIALHPGLGQEDREKILSGNAEKLFFS